MFEYLGGAAVLLVVEALLVLVGAAAGVVRLRTGG
jgi:hypothetical protein